MRVELILEALDKASKPIRAMQAAVKGANTEAARGAAKAAQAADRSTRSCERATRAQRGLAAGARAVGLAMQAAGRSAEQTWNRAIKGIENYSRRQAQLARQGFGQVGAGAKRAGQGLVAGGKVAAGIATGAGALGIAGAFVTRELVQPAGEFERYTAVLTTVEKSATKAQAAMAWVSQFAAKTPYDLAGVTEAFVRMRTFGLDPTNGSLKTLGDTSAAMGKPLMQAIEAIADAATGENERLKEFGIKASKQGKYFQYAYKDASGKQRIVKALATDQKAIEKALLGIFQSQFGGAMDAMSATWEGMMSNLGDQWSRFRLMIMSSGAFDYMKGRLSELLDIADRMAADGSLQKWASDLSTMLVKGLETGWAAAKGLGSALLTVANGAERLAGALGGWDRLTYLAMAAFFAQPIYYLASGLFLMSRGALTAALAIGRLGIMLAVSLSLNALELALRLTAAAAIGAASGTMLLGRALIFTAVAGAPGAALAVLGLARAAIGLPAAVIRAAAAVRALAVAATGLPALLMGAARGLVAMVVSGVRALPALLMGAARGIAAMAASGLSALPGLLLAAARGFIAFGAAMLATPVGWFIAGVAALAAAAYLIYENWDSIGPWLAEKWEAVKKVFADAWNALTSYDWSSLIPDLSSLLPDWDWSSWLPDWNWSNIIPAITLPSFDWSSILPDWNWSSIIPSLPDFSSWFGGGTTEAGPQVKSTSDLTQLKTQAAEAQKMIAAIGPAAQVAVSAASSVLAGASFHSQGVALMTTLAAGIRAGAGAAVGAVKGVAQQMRDHLPHSPAKVGPLSDLDRVRFSETLAKAVRPGPAVAAARSVAAGMRGALAPAAPRSGGLSSGSGGGAGGVTVHYAPQLVATGAGPEAVASFEKQLRAHADVLASLVDEALRRKKRLSY